MSASSTCPRGYVAAAIFNLIEDTATAEISRSQVWQWIRHGINLADGTKVDRDLVHRIMEVELENIRATVGDEPFQAAKPEEAQALFEEVAFSEDFVEFLTIPAYAYID